MSEKGITINVLLVSDDRKDFSNIKKILNNYSESFNLDFSSSLVDTKSKLYAKRYDILLLDEIVGHNNPQEYYQKMKDSIQILPPTILIIDDGKKVSLENLLKIGIRDYVNRTTLMTVKYLPQVIINTYKNGNLINNLNNYRLSISFYSAIFNSETRSIFILNPKLNFIDINKKFSELLFIEKENIVNKPFGIVLSSENSDKDIQKLYEFIKDEKKELHKASVILSKTDKNNIKSSISFQKHYFNNQFVGLLCYIE